MDFSLKTKLKDYLFVESKTRKTNSKYKTGVYAAFKVSDESARKIERWAKDNRIPNVLHRKNMHVTTVYSKRNIKYRPLKPSSPIKVSKDTMDIEMFKTDDNKNALAIRFYNKRVQTRWKKAMNIGATWGYKEYIPHVTISNDVRGKKEDIKPKITPPDFDIYLTEEFKIPLK